MVSSLQRCECAKVNCKDVARVSSHLELGGINIALGREGRQKDRLIAGRGHGHL